MSKNGKHKSPLVKPTHDALFRAIIDDKDRAAALLRDYLPTQIRDRMGDKPPKRVEGSFIDEDAHLKHSDGLFEITLTDGKPALIYVLLEHKIGFRTGDALAIVGLYVANLVPLCRWTGGKTARPALYSTLGVLPWQLCLECAADVRRDV